MAELIECDSCSAAVSLNVETVGDDLRYIPVAVRGRDAVRSVGCGVV